MVELVELATATSRYEEPFLRATWETLLQKLLIDFEEELIETFQLRLKETT